MIGIHALPRGGKILLAFMLSACAAGEQAGERTAYVLALPTGLETLELQIPADNPLTAAKVELGKRLYFDKRLSADSTVACASCHNPRFGFTDGQPVSTGVRGQRGGRSAPTIINRVFSAAQFWDGRATSLEEQAVGPIANPIEMGFTHDGVVKRLRSLPEYRAQFKRAFGTRLLTIEQVGKALAAYERTLVSGNSSFDRYQAGDQSALSPPAQRGLVVFREKARCQRCHAGPNFTDEQFHNIGVGAAKPNADAGRFAVTRRERDKGAFKTPTLRDVALSGPYFHDGSVATLEEVVAYYDRGGMPNPQLSPRMRALGLTAREKSDLVAFLRALTGEIALEAVADAR
ncbi:MAG: cytochrome-c peroxidase [Gemmatimonadota bacterium]